MWAPIVEGVQQGALECADQQVVQWLCSVVPVAVLHHSAGTGFGHHTEVPGGLGAD